MKIKPILADMSGRLQGIVASHNRGGQYFRGRTIPDTPPTPAQSGIRVLMTNCINRWTNVLTDDQRKAWNEYAVINTEIDGFGDAVNIGGVGWFVRANISRLLVPLDFVDDAPAIDGPANFTIVTPPVVSYNAGDIDVEFDASDAWAGDGGALLLFTSAGVSQTRYSAAGIGLRYAGAVLGDTGSPPTSPATITPAFTIPTDRRVYCKLVALDPDGRRSAPYRPFLDS